MSNPVGSFFKKIATAFIKVGTIVSGDITKLTPVVTKDIPEIAPFVAPIAALIQSTLGRATTTVIDIMTALGQAPPTPAALVPPAGTPGVAIAQAKNALPGSIPGPQTAELAGLELYENFLAQVPKGATVNQTKALAALTTISGAAYDLWNSIEVAAK
jgi:hypothetical protein